jgi:hypothetical protein
MEARLAQRTSWQDLEWLFCSVGSRWRVPALWQPSFRNRAAGQLLVAQAGYRPEAFGSGCRWTTGEETFRTRRARHKQPRAELCFG